MFLHRSSCLPIKGIRLLSFTETTDTEEDYVTHKNVDYLPDFHRMHPDRAHAQEYFLSNTSLLSTYKNKLLAYNPILLNNLPDEVSRPFLEIKFNHNQDEQILNPLKHDPQNPDSEIYQVIPSYKDLPHGKNGYVLKTGDNIVFGRHKLTVLEMRNKDEEPLTSKFDAKFFQKILPKRNTVVNKDLVCKYCLSGEGELIRPCNCTEGVHEECLREWVDSRFIPRNFENEEAIYNNVYQFNYYSTCELCKMPIIKTKEEDGKTVLDISHAKPKGPYALLLLHFDMRDYTPGCKEWSIFCFQPREETVTVKVGNGDCQVTTPGIAVSNEHFTMMYNGVNFVVSDNDSAYGTFVKIKEPLKVFDNLAILVDGKMIHFQKRLFFDSVSGARETFFEKDCPELLAK